MFIRFYLWFNSFRAFLLTQRRRGSQRFAEGFSSLRFSALSLRLGVKNGAFGWGRIRTRTKVGDRREEIGEREKGPRDHGPRTALLPAASSVFIRFYLWFNSFRSFLLTQRRRGSQRVLLLCVSRRFLCVSALNDASAADQIQREGDRIMTKQNPVSGHSVFFEFFAVDPKSRS